MTFPDYVLTRAVSVGGAMGLESARLLRIRVTTSASKSLIWDDTGYRFVRWSMVAESGLGTEVSVLLPRTDVTGWKDAATGALIDVSAAEGAYTHQYTTLVEFLDENGRSVGISPVTLGPYVVPDGDGPIDLDKTVPASTVAGGLVNVPDSWGAAVAAAEAAAAEAAANLAAGSEVFASTAQGAKADAAIPAAQKAAAGGVAPLDGGQRVPQVNLPAHLDPSNLANTYVLGADFIRRAGNAVLTDGDVVILGRFAQAAAATATNIVMGGATNTENVIGGNLDNVLEAGESAVGKPSNLTGAPALTGQNNGNWNAILGGYDIVVRGWANIVAGHHLKVTDDANHCHIGGGSYHSVAGSVAYGAIGGGTTNALGTGSTGGTIAGGLRNSLTGASAVIGGGQDNVNSGARATIAGGRNHSVTAESAAIGGGQDNTASNTNTSIMGGRNNTASGICAAVTGGGYNTASGTYSRAGGRGAVASHGQDAFASQEFVTPGDAQAIRQIIKRQTTDATASDLFDAAGLTPTCPENTSWAIRTRVIARRTETSVDTAAWDVTIIMQRGVGNTGAIVGSATITALGASAGAAAWTCTVSTHSDGRVRIIGTGEAAKTIRWVGSQEIVQVKQ